MLVFSQREARRQRQRDAKTNGSESVSAFKHFSSQEYDQFPGLLVPC
jgi:hypothetical protein